MAKRKRLPPPALQDAIPADLETKSLLGKPADGTPAPRSGGAAPIADMAGAAAATAALAEVSAEFQAARSEGRLVQVIPTTSVDPDYLVRDRLVADEAEMAVLESSIRARGQQTPIEVIHLGANRYGLISGWRRLRAITSLFAQTQDARFATVQALVRNPGTAQEAYVSMVEENEVRVGLSFFERARIVSRAVEAGVYAHEKQALGTLFASASRSKRSKIKSFLPIVAGLGDVLRFPTAISERLGLELSALLQDPDQASLLRDRLVAAVPQDAQAELEILSAAVTPKPQPKPSAPSTTGLRGVQGTEVASGLYLLTGRQSLRLSGPGVTAELVARIEALVRES